VRWQIEQAEEFRQDVAQYTDAERVALAGAYQALVRYGPLPHPGSPLEIHRLRDPRAGDAYVLVTDVEFLRRSLLSAGECLSLVRLAS
jgi:hypothetical protein